MSVLGECLREGDEVVITIPEESRHWGYNPCPDGTRATVLGFSEIHYGRVNNFGFEPGVYENRSWARLRMPDGSEHTESTLHLSLPDKAEESRRLDQYHASRPEDWRKSKRRLRVLPETKFWEYDRVRTPRDGEVVVLGIEYNWRDDGPTYRVSDHIGAGWHTYTHDSGAELIERGNVWSYYHGLPLKFDSLEEEAEFFNALGHTEEVRNPVDNLFRWTKDEVLAAIRDGIAHGFTVGGGLFGSGSSISAVRFRDEELGQRVAAYTLAGFQAAGGPTPRASRAGRRPRSRGLGG